MQYTHRESGLIVPATVGIREAGAARELRERIAELESGNDDGSQWLPLGGASGDLEFTRNFVNDIFRLARVMYVKNPLIKRGVDVKADYVFAREITITSPDPDVNTVLQTFLNDPHNQDTFTAHVVRIQRERELQIDGNIFFALIPHPETGRVRIRTVPTNEVTDIVTDPNDKHARWYYKREWIEYTTDLNTGEVKETRRAAFYCDWRYKPTTDRTKIGDIDIIDGVYIYHVKTGGFTDWKFGISELYAALDWARAYKTFLENWATIVSAYARFAFKMTVTGGKTGAVNARKKLEAQISTGAAIDRNPAPTTGAVYVAPEGNDIQPIRTAGATTTADDGRRLLLMVASSFGLPETFFGDVSTGNLATATSLDRPTELMLSNRQALWKDIYIDILRFVIESAIRAPDGALRSIADITRNEYGEDQFIYDDDAPPRIDVDFPSIVVRDPVTLIQAIKQGATLDGASPTVIPDLRIIARMVLTALGEDDIDDTLATLFPDDASARPATPRAPALPGGVSSGVPNDPATPDEANADALANATEALREAITTLAAKIAPLRHIDDAPLTMPAIETFPKLR